MQALQLQPGWGKAHSRIGAALFGLRRYEEAVEAYRRAATAEPKSATYREALAQVGRGHCSITVLYCTELLFVLCSAISWRQRRDRKKVPALCVLSSCACVLCCFAPAGGEESKGSGGEGGGVLCLQAQEDRTHNTTLVRNVALCVVLSYACRRRRKQRKWRRRRRSRGATHFGSGSKPSTTTLDSRYATGTLPFPTGPKLGRPNMGRHTFRKRKQTGKDDP